MEFKHVTVEQFECRAAEIGWLKGSSENSHLPPAPQGRREKEKEGGRMFCVLWSRITVSIY